MSWISTITAVTALLSALSPIVTVVINRMLASESRKDNAKNSIMLLIVIDKQRVSDGEPPVNYERVLHEADVYKANYGNSYMEALIAEYKHWYDQLIIKE